MDDRGGSRDGKRDGGGGRGGQGGPPDSAWLDMEISRVIHGRADDLARVAADELIKDAIKERLRERLGPTLEAIGRLAADTLADDVEANLEIEAKLATRREARRALGRRVDEIFGRGGGPAQGPGGDAPPGEVTGEGWDPRRT